MASDRRVRFSEIDITAMRRLHADGVSLKQIAWRYGTSAHYASRLVSGMAVRRAYQRRREARWSAHQSFDLK
jgi:hypothetical protein